MKLLIFAAGLVAVGLALRLLVLDIRRIGSRPTLAALAGPAVSLGMLAILVYVARDIGWFTVPIVALVFVPIGLSLRWSLLATRNRRQRDAEAPLPAGSRRDRAVSLVTWPLMLAVVIGAAALGAVAVVVASWR